jgi:dynein heavy chain
MGPKAFCSQTCTSSARVPSPNLQAGNILWARQLLRRIEDPMQRFAHNAALMGSKESKRVIRQYNRVAKALVEFEALWHAAWLKVKRAACGRLQGSLSS